MENSVIKYFLTFFVFVGCLFASEPVFIYNEFSSKHNLTTTWTTVEKSKDLLEITGEDEASTTILDCSKDFEISKFYFKSKKIQEEYTITLKKNVLEINSNVNNKKETKKHKISSPWIQQFGFGLKPFILSKDQSIKFCLVTPDNFDIQKMIAKKKQIETLNIEGKKYEAVLVTVTLPGFKSMFWKAKIWFDTKNGNFLKYQANHGPSTPVTTILLKKIKEGSSSGEKESFFKHLFKESDEE